VVVHWCRARDCQETCRNGSRTEPGPSLLESHHLPPLQIRPFPALIQAKLAVCLFLEVFDGGQDTTANTGFDTSGDVDHVELVAGQSVLVG